MTEKKSFVLYDNYFNQISFLDMEQRGELLTAIFELRNYGESKIQLNPVTQVVFSFIKDGLERDMEAYKRRCEANRENGKKGGRPSKKASDFDTQKPKKADNDNDNGNDNENDIDNDIDNGNGNGNGNDGGFPISEAISDRISDSVSDGASRALSEQDKKDLKHLGLPDGYLLGERVERASAYARERNMAVMDVLLDWWRADERRCKARERERMRAQEDPDGHTPNSYDLDEFFEAAVRRGLRELPPNGI